MPVQRGRKDTLAQPADLEEGSKMKLAIGIILLLVVSVWGDTNVAARQISP